jgi:hypothetical protein
MAANSKTAPPATQENRALAGEQATYRVRNHLEAFGCGEGNPRFCVPRPHGAGRARPSLREGTERASK